MGLNFAIDALYASGWTPDEPAACKKSVEGRAFPNEQSVGRYFRDHGCELAVTHVPLFDCYRAAWRDHDNANGLAGAVVGQSAEEAAVYAMSQLRRQVLAAVGA